ncbi:hypothetical protein IE53DRAFT_382967 [Violaceomyces palustris]|uniref:Uncharacterized protein n=1 Tax=Violaceomyces palustris TaxID=1673888 RepID=A0ACD0P8P4_9BASI|nr:hypothetical protein IE53DRAFT_382967 [Violaceomyces palustris]
MAPRPDFSHLDEEQGALEVNMDATPSSDSMASASGERNLSEEEEPAQPMSARVARVLDYVYGPYQARPTLRERRAGWSLNDGACSPKKRKVLYASKNFDPSLFTEEVVAVLKFSRGGQWHYANFIHRNRPFVIGRGPACDLVVQSRVISREHIRLYAHQTDSGETFVSCEDVSNKNGFLWNGIMIRGTSILLNDGDRLTLRECLTLDYVHTANLGSTKSSKRTQTRNEECRKGDYVIYKRILGTGSFGKVFLGLNERQQLQVACKRVAKKKCIAGQAGHEGMGLVQECINKEKTLLKDLSHVVVVRLTKWKGMSRLRAH